MHMETVHVFLIQFQVQFRKLFSDSPQPTLALLKEEMPQIRRTSTFYKNINEGCFLLADGCVITPLLVINVANGKQMSLPPRKINASAIVEEVSKATTLLKDSMPKLFS